MFIGHFALGFAARRLTPRTSLGTLFAAAQFADLLWPILVALGLERVRIDPGNTAFTPLDFVSYPYSHSLILLIVWGVVFGAVYRFRAGDGRSALVLAGLVVSHWMLDFVTHRRDMPLYPGSQKFGLGLWNIVPATLGLELFLYSMCLWAYVRGTIARNRIGRLGLASYAAFLVLLYLSNLAGPPPSIAALYVTALLGGMLLILVGWWVDRHREARERHEPRRETAS